MSARKTKKSQTKDITPAKAKAYIPPKQKTLPPANSVESFTGRKRIRRSFGRIEEVAEMPNLIEVQKTSYDRFLMPTKNGADTTLPSGLYLGTGVRTVSSRTERSRNGSPMA